MDVSRTHHADQAAHLSDLVGLKFANLRYGTTVRRLIHVAEPDGPSTDGGRKARQSIVLMPEDGSVGGAIVCGWLDVSRRTAELKSHIILGQAYQERYGLPLDLSRGEYQRLLDTMLDFLRAMEIDVRVTNIPRRGSTVVGPMPSPPAAPAVQRETTMLAIFIGGGVIFGFALCYFLFSIGALYID